MALATILPTGALSEMRRVVTRGDLSGYGIDMGLLSGLTKGAIGRRTVTEARKPANQARIKDAIGRVTGRRQPRTR
jgi:hypothetical protein